MNYTKFRQKYYPSRPAIQFWGWLQQAGNWDWQHRYVLSFPFFLDLSIHTHVVYTILHLVFCQWHLYSGHTMIHSLYHYSTFFWLGSPYSFQELTTVAKLNDSWHGHGHEHVLSNVVNFLNYRHEWDNLKSMLSFQLKQVWGGMLACILKCIVFDSWKYASI